MLSYKTHGQRIFKNSQQYVVQSWTDNSVTLKQTQGKHIGRTIDIDIKYSASFKPGYAMTVHKSQCLTIRENYSIYEYESMSKKMLYVVMTRAAKTHTSISVTLKTTNITLGIFIVMNIKVNITLVQQQIFINEKNTIHAQRQGTPN